MNYFKLLYVLDVLYCRYMMLIAGKGEVYTVDRDNSVFHVPNLEFPKRKDRNSHITNTLIDGVSGTRKASGR